MKKIKDERLVLQSLKNIRFVFIVQTLGIITILVYQGFTEGTTKMTDNPLWFVFIITVVILSWLNMRVSVDVYDHTHGNKKPWPYYRIIMIALIVGTVIGLLARFGPDKSEVSQALMIGGIVFVCFLVTFTIGHYLVKKRLEDR